MESYFYIAFTINKFQTQHWKWQVFRKPGLSEWLLMNIKGFISEHTEERVSTERKSYFRTLSVLHVNLPNLQINPNGKNVTG